MDFKPTITRESQILPGVRYTLRAMSYGRRVAMNLSLSEYRAKISVINREREPIMKEYSDALKQARDAAEPEVLRLVAEGKTRAESEAAVPLSPDIPGEKTAELARTWNEMHALKEAYVLPALVRALFVSVEGYKVNGKVPKTADDLIEQADERLVGEIAEDCKTLEGLTPDEMGNLQWPIISAPVEDGPKTPTDATPAGSAATT